MDKIFYNEASAAKLGWDPSWFGCSDFDDRLLRAIRKWQRENELTADGLVGPNTFRRLWTQREANIDDWKPREIHPRHGDGFIIHNGKFQRIEWDRVVLWSETPNGLGCKAGSYTSWAGKKDRKPSYFVTHWDVCLDSRSCARVLARRGISVHFMIDNDGTIYQALDTQHAAWHAGSRKWNNASIGVEISNAYYPKYQNKYVSRGLGARPIWDEAVVHGVKQKPFMGFYDVQIEALKALYKAVHKATGIPLETPLDSSGEMSTTVSKEAAANKFEGFISHFHLKRSKIDCAGLDIKKILEEIKNET